MRCSGRVLCLLLCASSCAALKKPTTRGKVTRGGGAAKARRGTIDNLSRPSFGWAVAHNWLYFLSLGLCIPVLPRVIAMAVNTDGSPIVSAKSSRIGGDVEGLDKLLTFLCVGALGALSDIVGRKPLIALSAAGYAATVGIQLSCPKAGGGVSRLFMADAVDGTTSCMSAVCSAYVADAVCSWDLADRAVAVGIFQGLSVGGAFILGFPISAALSTRGRYRRPMYVAMVVSILNALLAIFVTPESLPVAERTVTKGSKLTVAKKIAKESNPLSSLARIFRSGAFLRGVGAAYALMWLANLSLNTTFINYVNKVFQWGPQQAGPLLVVIGLMLAVVPRVLVPRVGTSNAVRFGALAYAAAFMCSALAKTPRTFVPAILGCGLGSVALPALVSLVAAQAKPEERGALLGALQTLQELAAAAAYPLYGRLFAFAIDKPDKMPLGAPFYAASALCLAGFFVADKTLPKKQAAVKKV